MTNHDTTADIRWDRVAAKARHDDPRAVRESGHAPEVTDREKLLAHYARKPVTEYVQYDLMHQPGGDGLAVDDEDGDIAYSTTSRELRHGFPVRIYVKRGTDRAEALRLIRKAAAWIEEGGDVFDMPGECRDASDGVHGATYRDTRDTPAPALAGAEMPF